MEIIMETELKECPVCRSKASCFPGYQHDSVFYDCPVCGRYEFTLNGFRIQKNNHLAPYLYYNRFRGGLLHSEYRYHTTMDKELCDTYKRNFEDGDITNGHPVHSKIFATYDKILEETQILRYNCSRKQQRGINGYEHF